MQLKTCTDCRQVKDRGEFSINRKKKDGLNYRCKECQSVYFKEYYKKNKRKHLEAVAKTNKRRMKEIRDLLDKHKNKPCIDCGNKYPPCAMDFDHLRDKSFNLSRATTLKYSDKKILDEIAKCEVVCAVCHRIRTHLGR